jgi:hypothetical protein
VAHQTRRPARRPLASAVRGRRPTDRPMHPGNSSRVLYCVRGTQHMRASRPPALAQPVGRYGNLEARRRCRSTRRSKAHATPSQHTRGSTAQESGGEEYKPHLDLFFAILIFSVHFSQKYFFINFKTRCTKTLLFTKKHYCFFSLSQKSTTIVFYYKAVPNSQTY